MMKDITTLCNRDTDDKRDMVWGVKVEPNFAVKIDRGHANELLRRGFNELYSNCYLAETHASEVRVKTMESRFFNLDPEKDRARCEKLDEAYWVKIRGYEPGEGIQFLQRKCWIERQQCLTSIYYKPDFKAMAADKLDWQLIHTEICGMLGGESFHREGRQNKLPDARYVRDYFEVCLKQPSIGMFCFGVLDSDTKEEIIQQIYDIAGGEKYIESVSFSLEENPAYVPESYVRY